MKTVINAKFDKIELKKHQDENNKDHALKKQLDLLRQDIYGEVPPNRLIMNNQLRNNNGGVAPNKIIIVDEQFKNNMHGFFSKKQRE